MPNSSNPELIDNAFSFEDIDALFEEIIGNCDLFHKDIRELIEGSPHKVAEKIPLREPVYSGESIKDVYDAWFERVDTQDTEYVDKLVVTMDLVEKTREMLDYDNVYRVMVVSLPSGGAIKPHADEGVYSNAVDRYHLVIGGSCTWNGFEMTAGNLYKTPHLKEHSVVAGELGRLALIMDFS